MNIHQKGFMSHTRLLHTALRYFFFIFLFFLILLFIHWVELVFMNIGTQYFYTIGEATIFNFYHHFAMKFAILIKSMTVCAVIIKVCKFLLIL